MSDNRCDQCEALMINGVYCHETGCPNAWRDETRECFHCGCGFKPDDRWQNTCNDCADDLVDREPTQEELDEIEAEEADYYEEPDDRAPCRNCGRLISDADYADNGGRCDSCCEE